MRGLGRLTPGANDAPWIDYRASRGRADHRCDPRVCPACGCELDIHPAPHSPRCPDRPATT